MLKDIKDKNEIEQFGIDNPDKKQKFDNYIAPEPLGDLWYEINIVEESVEQWKEQKEKTSIFYFDKNNSRKYRVRESTII